MSICNTIFILECEIIMDFHIYLRDMINKTTVNNTCLQRNQGSRFIGAKRGCLHSSTVLIFLFLFDLPSARRGIPIIQNPGVSGTPIISQSKDCRVKRCLGLPDWELANRVQNTKSNKCLEIPKNQTSWSVAG